MKTTEAKAPTIQVLERMFSLLDVLASYQDPVSLKLISEQTGLHPSTAHRILNDLAIGRYVDRPEAGSYRLGMRLLELGNLVKARLDVRDAALGPMRELHKLTHQPVNLSMRQGDEIVYIERTYSERSGMQVVRAIGGRAPLHLTSVGKLFLAHDDPQRVRAYATRTGLAGHTRNSITNVTTLERELSKVLHHGTARDDEELELGVRCMAAGILDDQGKLVAGLSISAPADRLEEAWMERLKATARKSRRRSVTAAAPADTRPRSRPRNDKGPGEPGLFASAEQAQEVTLGAATCAAGVVSLIHLRTRSASPIREYLPAESRNTMISLRPASCACMTRQRPASEM
jgi:DNA-binding IclR family transcriptional regulator